jgi:hypothetical protein
MQAIQCPKAFLPGKKYKKYDLQTTMVCVGLKIEELAMVNYTVHVYTTDTEDPCEEKKCMGIMCRDPRYRGT